MSVIPNYYLLPAVSCSDLKSLLLAFYAVPDRREALQDTFNFGSLVDAMLTEPHKVDHKRKALIEDTGNVIYFDEVTFRSALKLAEAMRKDPIVAQLLAVSAGQYVFTRRLSFEYEGDIYEIPARCKYDLFSKPFRTGADFKTTACTTLKAFRESIDFFYYDMGAAWYMDLAKIDTFWIIAISKKNGQIFKHAIKRGDETYESGRRKYSLWAYRWLLFVDSFNLTTV
jgi:hypothetical protein